MLMELLSLALSTQLFKPNRTPFPFLPLISSLLLFSLLYSTTKTTQHNTTLCLFCFLFFLTFPFFIHSLFLFKKCVKIQLRSLPDSSLSRHIAPNTLLTATNNIERTKGDRRSA
ncbi:hypothetical protein RIF29_18949 [Crotalaria pallida]|uniref:Uncharacterized protein n=1 Tax=Crotalaria pallida TaxID=3830 RepID=A0AAN9IAY9_CROPI